MNKYNIKRGEVMNKHNIRKVLIIILMIGLINLSITQTITQTIIQTFAYPDDVQEYSTVDQNTAYSDDVQEYSTIAQNDAYPYDAQEYSTVINPNNEETVVEIEDEVVIEFPDSHEIVLEDELLGLHADFIDGTPIGTIEDVFPDESLANSIATALSMLLEIPVSVADYVSLELLSMLQILPLSEIFLMLPLEPIEDLEGIQYLTGLVELSLIDNNISDLRPLSALTGLVELSLIGNNISDLRPLSALTDLKVLQIGEQSITDLQPLSDLTNLEELTITDNNLVDITALSYLTSLRGLNLLGNNISNIEPLSALTNLEWVRLGNNNISDLRPLLALNNLKWFDAPNQVVAPSQIFNHKGERVTVVDNQWSIIIENEQWAFTDWRISEFSGTVTVDSTSVAIINHILSANNIGNGIVIPNTATTQAEIVAAIEDFFNNLDGLKEDIIVKLDTTDAKFESGLISDVSIVLTQNPTHIITDQAIYWQYGDVEPDSVDLISFVEQELDPISLDPEEFDPDLFDPELSDPNPSTPAPSNSNSLDPDSTDTENANARSNVSRLPQAGTILFNASSVGIRIIAIGGLATWLNGKKRK